MKTRLNVRSAGGPGSDGTNGRRGLRPGDDASRRLIQRARRRGLLDEAQSAMSSGSLGGTLGLGILGGVGAGIFFLLFNLIMSAILGLQFLDPLRQIAAIALGSSVLPAASPLLNVLVVGLLVHASLSALYGATFAVAARYIMILRRDLMVATTVFGLGIWIVNYYVFTPLLFPWFDSSPDIVQFVAHTLFYGMPLGIILLEFTPSGGILAINGLQSPQTTRDADGTADVAE